MTDQPISVPEPQPVDGSGNLIPTPADGPDPSLTEEERQVTIPPVGDVPATDDQAVL